MADPLLQTKFFVPRPRRAPVPRPRLTERLGRGTAARLTLVSAPAGFGKTTVLAGWLAENDVAAAWLSLDETDSEPQLFWTYVITALQTVRPEVGSGALPLRPPIETVLTTLVNELSAVPDDVYLVLDDYHLVEQPEIQAGMTFLLDHLPPQVHLVISTRADPALPLARLRARGELVEIRSADLRFTRAEAAAYLGPAVSERDVATLESRTEGWIAALQLAALSMRGREDVAGFIAGFAGDDRYIVDYLVEEVLARQTTPVRDFLVQTSILDRLTGPLGDAVTGRADGKAMLDRLDRDNLFVVALDDSRRWYRYHHLFADVLRAYLGAEEPELHRRASRWYEHNGEPAAAIRHALAGGDADRAASLIELAIPALRMNRQEATIRGWLDAIPDEVVRARPVLAIGFIGALMAGNDFGDVERRLNDAERSLGSSSAIVVDTAELRRMPAAIAMYRAALGLIRGDVATTITQGQVAIDRAAADDHLIRSAASALLGLAYWSGGDLDAAHRNYSISVEGLERAGHLSDVLGCSITLADIRVTQGRLADAQRTYEHALRLAAGQPGPPLRGTADMHVGMSQIAYERGDVDAASRHLRRAEELGEHNWLPQNPYRWRVAMAALREAEGDVDGALALLDQAQDVYVGDFSPNVRPVPAMRARVLVAHGRVDAAAAWARENGLSAGDDLSYLREFEHITLARVLLAQRPADAEPLLHRLLAAAEAGGRTGTVIEILVLLALTHHARGDVPRGLAALRRARTLAEPEGYVRVFAGAEAPRRPAPALIDPLSERERGVLRLLASDLGGPAIARELSISLNTLRTHTKNIYAKLGVNDRRAAVRRAAELNL